MDRAIRSFTEPVGLYPSNLAKIRIPALGLNVGNSTSGVLPMESIRFELRIGIGALSTRRVAP